MTISDEEERVWGRLDRHGDRLADHCKRITTIEQDHVWKEKNKANKVAYLLAVIVVLEFLFLAWDKIW